MQYENPSLVRVTWLDAESAIGWEQRDDSELETIDKANSVGWLIAENDSALMLAADMDDSDSSNRTLIIPKPVITSITSLVDKEEE